MSHILPIDTPRDTRIRPLARAALALHPGAREACLAWISVPERQPDIRPVCALTFTRKEQALCFSGFASLCSSPADPIHVHILGAPTDDQIRYLAWSDVLDPTGINTPAARRQWLEALKAYLPDDLARMVFGPRGLTLAAAAAHLGISRRTLERDRREAEDV